MVAPFASRATKQTARKAASLRVAAKCGVCVVALLGFVVEATTFVARLAAIRILPATQSAEDLIRGSLSAGAASMSAPFNAVSCGSLRPFPLHAARVRVRGARAHGFVARRLFGLHQTALLAPRPAPGLHTVAYVRGLIRGSLTYS